MKHGVNKNKANEVRKNWLAEVEDASDFTHRMYLCAELAGSVNALAQVAGISQGGIRNYFAGSEPNRSILSRLARAAGVRFQWLGEGAGPMRDLPAILIHSVLRCYHNFRRQHALPESLNARKQFVTEYNQGSMEQAENVHRLLPRIALIELKDWVAGVTSTAAAAAVGREDERPGLNEEQIVTALRELESENSRLKQMYAELSVAYQALEEELRKVSSANPTKRRGANRRGRK